MARHYAFPGFTIAANGHYIASYRDGPEHNKSISTTLANRGVIRVQSSTDGGATWGSSSIVQDDGENDSRDSMLRRLSNDKIVMSFFRSYAGTSAAFVSISADNGSSWGTPVSLATSWDAPRTANAVTELGNGDLLAPIYGYENSGDATRSVAVVKSTDGGATWGAPVIVAEHGSPTNADWAEPELLLLQNGDVHCYIRELDSGEIWKAVSSDDGATWTTPTSQFVGSGRPAAIQVGNGAIVLAFRGGGAFQVEQSADNGATWVNRATIDNSGSWVYGQMQQVTARSVGIVYAIENSSTDADLFYREITF